MLCWFQELLYLCGMENTEIILDQKVEDLILQLQKLLGTGKLRKTWKGDNETNIPDEYRINVGGYGNNHKVEIIITPKEN
jgi:hypothetical protein